MGVLNVTPDSFSDGGQFNSMDAALSRVESMIASGAAIIDIGGESTRPGAKKVSIQEEVDRVCPVLEQVRARFDTIVSVDTSSPGLMSEAIRLGAGMINDVRAFSREGAVQAVMDSASGKGVALCVMHMQGDPASMQKNPSYTSVVEDVLQYLTARIDVLVKAGVSDSRIVLDPGFGFGKSLAHNLDLLNQVHTFCSQGYPVLIGLSRKSMLGAILDKPADQRLMGSIVGAVVAAYQGASIIRVHDVEESRQAMMVVNALRQRLAQHGESDGS